MKDTVKSLLSRHGIDHFGVIPISECKTVYTHLMPGGVKTAVVFDVPYRCGDLEMSKDGFSEYARIYDYHKYFENLFDSLCPELERLTGERFYGFADRSPIDEKYAAARCGLGVLGKNTLFIDKIYGSFVFIASILTSAELEHKLTDISTCNACNICLDACHTGAISDDGINRDKCLSAVSQKKKKSNEELIMLREAGIVWGCDICQNVCPYNKAAKVAPVAYFSESRKGIITKEFIENLDEGEFNKYAFAYKGKKIVLENIENIQCVT